MKPEFTCPVNRLMMKPSHFGYRSPTREHLSPLALKELSLLQQILYNRECTHLINVREPLKCPSGLLFNRDQPKCNKMQIKYATKKSLKNTFYDSK